MEKGRLEYSGGNVISHKGMLETERLTGIQNGETVNASFVSTPSLHVDCAEHVHC